MKCLYGILSPSLMWPYYPELGPSIYGKPYVYLPWLLYLGLTLQPFGSPAPAVRYLVSGHSRLHSSNLPIILIGPNTTSSHTPPTQSQIRISCGEQPYAVLLFCTAHGSARTTLAGAQVPYDTPDNQLIARRLIRGRGASGCESYWALWFTLCCQAAFCGLRSLCSTRFWWQHSRPRNSCQEQFLSGIEEGLSAAQNREKGHTLPN